MLCFDSGDEPNSSCDAAATPWTCQAAGPDSSRGRGFAALSRTALATRYLSWEGASGKSYVFTVYAAADCPAFCDAVLLVVARGAGSRRWVLAALDTGPFPEPALARAERDFSRFGDALEFHIHLLARSPAERREAIADLAARLIRSERK